MTGLLTNLSMPTPQPKQQDSLTINSLTAIFSNYEAHTQPIKDETPTPIKDETHRSHQTQNKERNRFILASIFNVSIH